VEENLRALGVREELCAVQVRSEEDNKLSDEIWTSMRASIIRGFTR
jgi:hypothetical protein